MASLWASNFVVRNILAELLMPPGFLIVLVILVLIVIRKTSKLQSILLGIILFCMWTTSTTAFSQMFYQWSDSWIHWPKPLKLDGLPQENAQHTTRAIVVLGGGVREGALDVPQYQMQDVAKEPMERLRMGARLAKVTQAPILVSGGRPNQTISEDRSEGKVMAQVLREEFGIKMVWVEGESNTTEENAKLSLKILKEQHIDTIYLVSNDLHLPRATYIFEKQGLHVIPAPVGFTSKRYFLPLDYFPSNDGFTRTRNILHELIGQIWYRIRF